MKISNSVSVVASVSFALSLIVPMTALAATTPSLGTAASYAVLGSTYTNTSATTINGSVGFTTGPAVAPVGTHASYGSGAPYATAGTDQGSALSSLASQACTFTFPGGAINLSADTTHGPIGVYTPGVYCSSGAMDVGGPLTLNGNGTYIFRAVGALTTTAGAVVTLSGASACDVFWTPSAATTLAANTTFAGTVISDAGITVGANSMWQGLALSFGGTVTTDTDIITAPTCSTPAPTPPAPVYGCMDSTATNYNASATSQTGVTCTYPVVPTVTTPNVVTPVVTTPTVTTTTVTPTLPNAGLPPRGTNSASDAAMVTGILMMILASLAVIQKRRNA